MVAQFSGFLVYQTQLPLEDEYRTKPGLKSTQGGPVRIGKEPVNTDLSAFD